MNRIAHLLVVVAFATLAATEAKAAPGAALVIGNGAYPGKRMALANPVNDANTMTAKLRARGFRVTVLTDATLARMRAAVAAFASETSMTPGAELSNFFYYSGHGVQIGGVNYLVPVDARATDAAALAQSALPLTEVLGRVRGLASRVNFIVLDACRDNPFVEDRHAPQGLAPMDALSNAFIAFSTSSGMAALDGDGRNSRFTAALAVALSDETASAQDVFRRARDYVVRTTEGGQTPEYVDTIAISGADPWKTARIGAPYIGQTRGFVNADAHNDLSSMATTAWMLRATPAPAADAPVLAGHVRALRAVLDTGAQDAAIKPDYTDETYEPMLRRVLAAAAADHWSEYDLALFLAHAAQETYQFQALAEYGSEVYFARYQGRVDLGNLQPGDGARYRGRGLLQLRGRAAYRRLGADPAIHMDIEANPDLIATDPDLSAKVAVAMFREVRAGVTGVPVLDLARTTRRLTGSTRDIGLRGHYFYRLLQNLPSALLTDAPDQ